MLPRCLSCMVPAMASCCIQHAQAHLGDIPVNGHECPDPVAKSQAHGEGCHQMVMHTNACRRLDVIQQVHIAQVGLADMVPQAVETQQAKQVAESWVCTSRRWKPARSCRPACERSRVCLHTSPAPVSLLAFILYPLSYYLTNAAGAGSQQEAAGQPEGGAGSAGAAHGHHAAAPAQPPPGGRPAGAQLALVPRYTPLGSPKGRCQS